MNASLVSPVIDSISNSSLGGTSETVAVVVYGGYAGAQAQAQAGADAAQGRR